MTNLELLLKCDSELRQYVVEFISNNYCIDPNKMKIQNHSMKCEKCPFSIRREENNSNLCADTMQNWLIQERSEVGGGPDE